MLTTIKESILKSTGVGKAKYTLLSSVGATEVDIKIQSKTEDSTGYYHWDKYNDASDAIQKEIGLDYHKFIEDFWNQECLPDSRLYKLMNYLKTHGLQKGAIWKPEDFDKFKKIPGFSQYKISYPTADDLVDIDCDSSSYNYKEFCKIEGKNWFALFMIPSINGAGYEMYQNINFLLKPNKIKSFFAGKKDWSNIFSAKIQIRIK